MIVIRDHQNFCFNFDWPKDFDMNLNHKIEFSKTNKHETLTKIHSIHVYINIINNRLEFKMKDRYKLELKTPEMTKLFGAAQKN